MRDAQRGPQPWWAAASLFWALWSPWKLDPVDGVSQETRLERRWAALSTTRRASVVPQSVSPRGLCCVEYGRGGVQTGDKEGVQWLGRGGRAHGGGASPRPKSGIRAPTVLFSLQPLLPAPPPPTTLPGPPVETASLRELGLESLSPLKDCHQNCCICLAQTAEMCFLQLWASGSGCQHCGIQGGRRLRPVQRPCPYTMDSRPIPINPQYRLAELGKCRSQ